MKLKLKAGFILRFCGIAAVAATMHCGDKLAGSEVANEKSRRIFIYPMGTGQGRQCFDRTGRLYPFQTATGPMLMPAASVIRTTADDQGRYSLQALTDNGAMAPHAMSTTSSPIWIPWSFFTIQFKCSAFPPIN